MSTWVYRCTPIIFAKKNPVHMHIRLVVEIVSKFEFISVHMRLGPTGKGPLAAQREA
jgi:hypothetical protein